MLPDGSRDILGIWIEQTEVAKFWMKVFTDLKTRGCRDILILIAVTDGLKGMSEALAAVFPDAQNAPIGGLEKPHRTRLPTAPTRIVINALHTKNLTLPCDRCERRPNRRTFAPSDAPSHPRTVRTVAPPHENHTIVKMPNAIRTI